jgi:hypothetical protein
MPALAQFPISALVRHNRYTAVSICRGSLRTRTKLFAALSVVAGAGVLTLSCYAFFIKVQAESLLKDLTTITVGSSTESDVEQLTRKHSRYLVSREYNDEVAITTFKVDNRWLSALRLEPAALFGAAVYVKNGRAYHIGAWLMRSMEAGMVDEYAELPKYLSRGAHYEFPTPIGKPYLRVRLDSHASEVQRRHAFALSFSCLIKPGGGCDLPCDYLPLAWQDWKTDLHETGLSEFNQHYPNSSRCNE